MLRGGIRGRPQMVAEELKIQNIYDQPKMVDVQVRQNCHAHQMEIDYAIRSINNDNQMDLSCYTNIRITVNQAPSDIGDDHDIILLLALDEVDVVQKPKIIFNFKKVHLVPEQEVALDLSLPKLITPSIRIDSFPWESKKIDPYNVFMT